MPQGTLLSLLLALGAVLAAFGQADDLPLGGGDDLPQLDESRLKAMAPVDRARAIAQILARANPDDFLDLAYIVEGFGEEDNVQEQAVEVLRRTGGERLVPLGQRLLQSPAGAKQVFGVSLLGAAATPEARTALLAAADEKANDLNVRFALVQVFAVTAEPRAAARLRAWAADPAPPELHRATARLALGFVGDLKAFPQCLTECEKVLAQRAGLAHDLVVMVPYWKPADLRAARIQLKRCDQYLDLFARFLRTRAGPPEVTVLRDYLRPRPDGALVGLTYQLLDPIITPQTALHFQSLLAVSAPEFQEELARVIAERGDGATVAALLAAVREQAASPRWTDRLLVLRLVDLFPVADRPGLLAAGLRDAHACVVEEALDVIWRERVPGLAEPLAALRQDPRWAAHAPVRDRLLRASRLVANP